MEPEEFLDILDQMSDCLEPVNNETASREDLLNAVRKVSDLISEAFDQEEEEEDEEDEDEDLEADDDDENEEYDPERIEA